MWGESSWPPQVAGVHRFRRTASGVLSAIHTRPMARRTILPAGIQSQPFSVAKARSLGVTRDALRSRQLSAPFHGVRAATPPNDTRSLCIAYLELMNGQHVFSHVTAAMLWGAPLPQRFAEAGALLVRSIAPARAPRGRGVVGHQLGLTTTQVRAVGEFRLTSPAMTWLHLASQLDLADLVAVADFFVTPRPRDRHPALATCDDLAREVAAHTGSRGQARCARALSFVRVGPRSRPESLLRVLLGQAGLPEPVLNTPIGRHGYQPDLLWPEFKVALEYEGDYHRQRRQFRDDIRRIESIVDDGWMTAKASADDLFDRPSELAARVGRRLASRGWRGTCDLRSLGRFVR